MTEYISKQDVIDYLNGYLHSLGEDADTLFNRGQRRALINSIQDILAVKAADVQAVRHGRWVAENQDNRGYADCFTCTNCKNYVYTYTLMRSCEFDYCPNCGARMDLKDDEPIKG